jgi:putative MATE family efflux protein
MQGENEEAVGTEGVRTLTGDPRRAIRRLAWPMIVAMSAQTLYNLADGIWVSGLGPAALSAVGFFFPFFFLGLALSNGIGVGVGAAISRRIGARDKEGADAVAAHGIVLMLFAVAVYTGPLLLLARPLFALMGAGAALDLCLAYSHVMFAGAILLFFGNVAGAILRSEGDAKRAMRALMAGAFLNILLDPLFIYVLGWGVAGAAWASLVSRALVALVLARWLFLRKDTYVTFRFRGFRFRGEILRDIARVGVPASVSHMSMFLMAFAITTIVAAVGGTAGVAVYTTGWRVVSLAILPMLGIATAVTAVCGAAWGARDPGRARTAYLYALRLGVGIEVVIALVTLALAPLLALAFTWSQRSMGIQADLVEFLRIIWVLYPTVAFGMLSSAMFQGVGRGSTALAMTLLRTLVFTVPFAWFLGVLLEGGLLGVWAGMVLAGVVYSPIALGWALRFLARARAPAARPAPDETDRCRIC